MKIIEGNPSGLHVEARHGRITWPAHQAGAVEQETGVECYLVDNTTRLAYLQKVCHARDADETIEYYASQIMPWKNTIRALREADGHANQQGAAYRAWIAWNDEKSFTSTITVDEAVDIIRSMAIPEDGDSNMPLPEAVHTRLTKRVQDREYAALEAAPAPMGSHPLHGDTWWQAPSMGRREVPLSEYIGPPLFRVRSQVKKDRTGELKAWADASGIPKERVSKLMG